MARYIDADELLKDLCTVSAPTPSESWIVEKCIEKVNEQPTTDVVPKSEVDKLHEVIFMKEDLMQSIVKERNYYYDELQKAKREVEEIVRQWKEEANCWQNNYITEIRANEQIKAEIFEEIEEVLNELGYFDEIDLRSLKKKYTESEDK